MLKSTRCVLVTILGVVLVFGCDTGTQVCKDDASTIAKKIKDNLKYLLEETTKLDLLRVLHMALIF